MEQTKPGHEGTILGRQKIIIHKIKGFLLQRGALLISGHVQQSNNSETKRQSAKRYP